MKTINANFTFEDLKALKDGEGATLKGYKSIAYESGYQVALFGVENGDVHYAWGAIQGLNGNCGVWYSDGIYYVDYSYRVDTKHKALKIGREHKQLSVLAWKTMELIWC